MKTIIINENIRNSFNIKISAYFHWKKEHSPETSSKLRNSNLSMLMLPTSISIELTQIGAANVGCSSNFTDSIHRESEGKSDKSKRVQHSDKSTSLTM